MNALFPELKEVPSKEISFSCLVIAIIYFIPTLFLFQFSKNAAAGVKYNKELQLTHAFSKLRSFFKYWAIMTLIIVISCVLLVMFAVAGGVSYFNAIQQ
jgi:hypothetical protein